MIITRVGGGGLGIQLFQYASGYTLASRLKTDLLVHRVTDAKFRTSYSWDYRLSQFDLGETFVAGKDIYRNLRVPKRIHDSAYRLPLSITRRSAWTDAHFQPNWSSLPDRILIEGVRVGFKYLLECEDEIISLFAKKPDLSSEAVETLEELESTDSVVVHWRLGGYKQSSVHADLGADYYLAVIRQELDRSTFGRVHVFSDEPRSVSDLVYGAGLSKHVKAMSLHSPDQPEKDLALMTRAKTFVMSNSTYSWWAAFLNRRPGVRVIAPPRFFADNEKGNLAYKSDVLKPEWIQASNRVASD